LHQLTIPVFTPPRPCDLDASSTTAVTHDRTSHLQLCFDNDATITSSHFGFRSNRSGHGPILACTVLATTVAISHANRSPDRGILQSRAQPDRHLKYVLPTVRKQANASQAEPVGPGRH